MNKPKKLRRGDVIGLICPASAPVSGERIDAGVRYLESLGYRVKPGRWIGERHGDFAGTDQQRVDDLNEMLRDRQVRAIIAVRGGYGCPRLLDRVDYAAARRDPKILVGYSDLTALQMALWRRAKLVTFSGPMSGVEFWQGIDPYTETQFWDTITSVEPTGLWEQPPDMPWVTRQTGCHEGPLLGGCLSLVVGNLGTPYNPVYRGSVLVLEDVGEQPYRLDRMLTQLKNAGVMRSLSGLLLGQFNDCQSSNPEKPHLIWSQILDEVLDEMRDAKIPILENLAYGHVPVKRTIPWGIPVRIDATQQQVRSLEGAVTD
jgi:muramoyltetrapeptide carboxypeptidase